MDNHQQGPPGSGDALADVVARVSYKPGWCVWLKDMERDTEHLAGSEGLTLCIAATVQDSTSDDTTTVEHWFAVPPAEYDAETWQRWVLDQVLLVEQHEALEFFRVDGAAPYFPAHGQGRNPYTIAAVPGKA